MRMTRALLSLLLAVGPVVPALAEIRVPAGRIQIATPGVARSVPNAPMLGGSLGGIPTLSNVSAPPAAAAAGAGRLQEGVGAHARFALPALTAAGPQGPNSAPNGALSTIGGLTHALYTADASGADGRASAATNAAYDGSALKPESSDWTAVPARTPLAALMPSWNDAESARAGDLIYEFPNGSLTALGDESTLGLEEELKSSRGPSVKELTGEAESLAFGRRERYEVEGLSRGALIGDKIAGIDRNGELVVFSARSDKSLSFKSPMGKVERFVADKDGMLYVAAGGTLQRWDLSQNKAVVLMDERASGLKVSDLRLLPNGGVEAVTDKGHFYWAGGKLSMMTGGPGSIRAESGAAPSLREAGGGFHLETLGGKTRLWVENSDSGSPKLSDRGTVPFKFTALAHRADRRVVYGLVEEGVVEWDLETGRYRSFAIESLKIAASGAPVSIETSPEGGRVLLSVGDAVFYADFAASAQGAQSKEAATRIWSEQNPMFIKDGFLNIGAFKFPVTARPAAPRKLNWLQSLWSRVTGWKPAPGPLEPPVSRKEWAAVNLPSNKWALYQTLKGFTLGQHVLYIGETGGGKTWMASQISKLTGLELWMASLNEYTKNQDLIARDTFGEEGKGKTGLSKSVVLKWLERGGILLLDEMHKPLEGLSVVNNILQNLEYRMSDGTVVRGDPKKSFVIGTMNPVKPPYRGEPPSGELSSRFGLTLQVNYLPPAEEGALLQIFEPTVAKETLETLVAIARDLRKVYPDVLPLPISSRTLIHIAQHIARFPTDDPVEIFKSAYNPGTIVEDASIPEAIDKALKAHDLRRTAQKKKLLN